jgi:hypothetical protein
LQIYYLLNSKTNYYFTVGGARTLGWQTLPKQWGTKGKAGFTQGKISADICASETVYSVTNNKFYIKMLKLAQFFSADVCTDFTLCKWPLNLSSISMPNGLLAH